MQIVINISKKLYDRYKEKDHIKRCDIDEFEKALDNCIIIPKGHGRIADMDEAIKCIEELAGDDVVYAISLIEWACGKRTIIEADMQKEVNK